MAKAPSGNSGDLRKKTGSGNRFRLKAAQLEFGELIDDEGFSEAAEWAHASEAAITRHEFRGENIQSGSYPRIDIARGRITGCALVGCDFTKSSFEEVEFVGCDFSNSDFTECYVKHCRFIDCKAMGTKFSEAIWRDVIVRDSCFSNAYFDSSHLNDVVFSGSDCIEASFTEVKIERLTLDSSKFIDNDFFQTKLDGVDFSTCDFGSPIVSNPPTELRGVQVNMFQAVDLAGLMGVVVKD